MKITYLDRIYSSGIYLIRNKKSGKVYIGSAINIWKRIFGNAFTSHIRCLNKRTHHNKHLQSAWNKYGESFFEYEVLELCSKEMLIEREQYYLNTILKADEYKGKGSCYFTKYGYNMCPIAGNTSGRSGRLNAKSQKVIQYNSSGQFISVKDSVFDVAKELSISSATITNSIYKGYKGAGFYWKFFTKDFPKNLVITKGTRGTCYHGKKITGKHVVTNMTLTFDSISNAAIYFGMTVSTFHKHLTQSIINGTSYKDYLWEK